jgi:hypothetical protein
MAALLRLAFAAMFRQVKANGADLQFFIELKETIADKDCDWPLIIIKKRAL